MNKNDSAKTMALHKKNPNSTHAWCGAIAYQRGTRFVESWDDVTCSRCIKRREVAAREKAATP